MGTLILTPRFSTLVGIDSDGCVFDSMRVKQCEHFHPLIIRYWHLEALEKPFRACAEFVNLASPDRGSNRFVALMREFEWLKTYPGVAGTSFQFPDFSALRAYVRSGVPLGNPTLKQAVAASRDPELAHVLEWSLAVDADIAAHMRPIPPFTGAVKALKVIQGQSDAVVISQTPEAALAREWTTQKIRPYVSAVAGLEFGLKADQLRAASQGRYAPEKILMIGDAIGDESSAAQVGVCFFPILPGAEESSWSRFLAEAYPRFLAGTYAGAYQSSLLKAFDSALSAIPPWEK